MRIGVLNGKMPTIRTDGAKYWDWGQRQVSEKNLEFGQLPSPDAQVPRQWG